MSEQLPSDIAKARAAHLTSEELRLARSRLGIDLDQIDGPPEGVVVALRGSLMPWHASGIGGRLMKYAGLDGGQYLGKLRLVTMFDDDKRRDGSAYIERAEQIAKQLNDDDWRVLLVGADVGAAFGLSGFFRLPFLVGKLALVCVPDPRAQGADVLHKPTGAAVLWCAGYVG